MIDQLTRNLPVQEIRGLERRVEGARSSNDHGVVVDLRADIARVCKLLSECEARHMNQALADEQFPFDAAQGALANARAEAAGLLLVAHEALYPRFSAEDRRDLVQRAIALLRAPAADRDQLHRLREGVSQIRAGRRSNAS